MHAFHVPLSGLIERRATEIEQWGLAPLDALHVASAESARAHYFLTTDDILMRKARRRQKELKVKIENPVKWLIQYTSDEG